MNERRNGMWFNRKSDLEDCKLELNNRIANLETQKKYFKQQIIELDQKNKRLQETIRNEDYKIGGIKVTASMAEQSVSRYRKREAEIARNEIESKILEAADNGWSEISFRQRGLVQFIKSNIEYFEEKGFDVKISESYVDESRKSNAIISWYEKTEFEKLVDKMGDRYVLELSFNPMNETEKLIDKYSDEIYKKYNVKYDSGNLIYTKR